MADLSQQSETSSDNQPVVALPPGAYARQRRYSRTKATSVSFSWRAKILWSLPPVLFVYWLSTGVLGVLNPLAWFLGIITFPYLLWWFRHVWTRAPLALDPGAVIPPTVERGDAPHVPESNQPYFS
jgi:hypothetical protein